MQRLVGLLMALAVPAQAQEVITDARYISPSAEYGHGEVPNGEFAGLEVTTADGAPNIVGGIHDCGKGPEIFTASSDWARAQATRLVVGRLHSRDLGAYAGPDSLRC